MLSIIFGLIIVGLIVSINVNVLDSLLYHECEPSECYNVVKKEKNGKSKLFPSDNVDGFKE